MRNPVAFVAGLVAALGTQACSCNPNMSPDEAARACVILEACFPNESRNGFFGGSLAACSTGSFLPPSPGALMGTQAVTTGLEKPLGDIYRCVLAAGGDCKKAGACWARTGAGGDCSANAIQRGACEVQVLSGCTADGQTLRVDCAAYGETCHEASIFFAQVAVCDLGGCPTTPRQCRGSQAEYCQGKALWLADCGRSGLSCVMPSDGGGAECDTPETCDGGASTCEGNTAVICNFIGKTVRQDCARNASLKRCEAGACVETGNECSLVDRATCNGTKVSFCQDGFTREVDCSGLGFSGCQNGACVVSACSGAACCTPTTCVAAGATCGSISDGCGGTLSCGSCTTPQTCGGSGTANVCGVGSCTPTTCLARGFNCGTASNGCGATLNCGTCTSPQICSGNVCGCTPRTSCPTGQNCGTAPDGCGGTVSCGSCTAPEICAGAGSPNVCGAPCVPTTCQASGYNCGSAPDGCGQTISCGSCNGNRTCGGGGRNVCGTGACTVTTCAAQGKNCGIISDGCGSTLPCGSCTSPQSCTANVCQ